MLKNLETSTVSKLIKLNKKRLNHLFPLNYFYSNSFALNRDMYKTIKKGVMQFVFLKPITSILSLIFYFKYNLYTEGSFSLYNSYIYIALINNTSVSISLYCLVLFYFGFENDLAPFRPLSKFLCVKFVIFFSFWQTCFLKICWVMKLVEFENAKIYQSLLVCFEMMIASIAHSFAFSHTDFVDYSKSENQIYKKFKSVIDVTDLIDDAEVTFIHECDDKQLVDMNVESKNNNIRANNIVGGDTTTTTTSTT